MPKRWTERERKEKVRLIEARDGPDCRDCGVSPNGDAHTIDHIDHDRFNDADENLQFLCRPCNTAKRNTYMATLARRGASMPGALSLSYTLFSGPQIQNNVDGVDALSSHKSATSLPLDNLRIDDEDMPVPVRISHEYKRRFFAWLIPQLEKEGSLDHMDTVYAATTVVGCSAASIREYLKGESSSAGTIEVYRDEAGKKRLRLRGLAGPSPATHEPQPKPAGHETGKEGR